MKSDRIKLERKLASYSALAAGILISGQADAQIKYKDVDPDKIINAIDSFMLDLNQDGVYDYKLMVNKYLSSASYGSYKQIVNVDFAWIEPLNDNEILNRYQYSYYNSNFGAALLEKDDVISSAVTSTSTSSMSSNSSWTNSYGILNAKGYMFYSYGGYTSNYNIDLGFFQGVQDKFVGLRLIDSSGSNIQWHYGWLRLDVSLDAKQVVVKDYAVNMLADHSIKAGEMGNVNAVEIVSNIVAMDNAENSNGSDIKVTFNMIEDENNLKEYRVIVVKASKASAFNLVDADNLATDRYTVVNKTGSDLSASLPATSKDTDGDLIKIGIDYQVFVASIADGVNKTENSISTENNAKVTLHTTAPVVAGLGIMDYTNNNDASDILVFFNKADDESRISSYRAIVVKSANAGTFSLNDANQLTNDKYFEYAKTGNNPNFTLNSSTKDNTGAVIENGNSYKVFVLSVADGSNADINSLTGPSNEISMKTTGFDELVDSKITYFVQNKNLIINHSIENPKLNLQLIDLNGKVVIKEVLLNNHSSINLSFLPSGIYLMKIMNNQELFSGKVFIE